MLVPVKWLKNYLNLDNISTREIANRVTDSGSHVESINSYQDMSKLVVAEILDIKKSESSDKLNLVDIDYGEEKLTVVSSATNMKKGDKVVFAKIGAKLPFGVEIKEATLGGVLSKGMLCGYKELGVNEDHVLKNSQDGLIILNKEAKIGNDAIQYLDLDGETIEFEITPNRPDCLSIIGMAREVAAVFQEKIIEPSLEISNQVGKYNDLFKGVKNESKNVKRFLTAVVKDVEIKNSPMYIQNYLRDAGIRPINNIVDFTNYVMLEYGQPLHVYDLDKIESNSLIVREDKDGEELTTLDNEKRIIKNGDIVICDGNSNPIGFAGIMGGANTEVSDNTKNILIEAACFDSEYIKKTSKRLTLRTEASSRFEKGVPAKNAEYGIKRFLYLVSETNSGTVVEGIHSATEFKFEKKFIRLRNDRVNQILGLDLSIENTKKYLDSLELDSEIEGEELKVSVPYFREDLQLEVDLIEEIGRLYGFHNIKPKPLKGELTQGIKSNIRKFQDEIRNTVYAQGFTEILTYSFISKKQFDNLNIEDGNKLRDVIKILNPLGEDYSVMRTTLIGNMLGVIKRNLNNKQNDLRFYEVGNTFHHNDNRQMLENKLLTIGMVGDYDYYYLKNVLINLFNKFGIEKVRFEREENNPIFHAGRTANIIINGESIGVIGEISPFVVNNFEIEKRVYISELNLDKMIKFINSNIQYKMISKYPTIERDIAFIINEDIESQQIIDVINENGGEYLVGVQLFDRYKGEQIEKGKVSLAYKILFQSQDSTLKDKDIKQAFKNIENGLKSTFNTELRS